MVNKILKYIFFYIALLCFPFLSSSQDCNFTITGKITDQSTGLALPYANVLVEEMKTGDVADETGQFEIKNICGGEYHLRISHIACEAQHIFLKVYQDTNLVISLVHHPELMDEIVIHGEQGETSTQVNNTLLKDEISQESNKNLADIVGTIAGVSVLKNGSGISKPMIHGLYGNRVSILNNGIAQSGQQWGNDHAPEIDPFVADHISVIKGASALAYGGSSLGGVILVETKKIPNEPHLHGNINYIFQTNGRGHTFNTQLEKFSKLVAWRFTGTLKTNGDMRSPDYFLTNTGKKEGNLALQLEKQISDKWTSSLYYSWFNAEIGILRGSHVGNLTDLEDAIGRDKPFFTHDKFSYSIAAPRQEVEHHLLKFRSDYLIDNQQSVNFTYGGQLNKREEFDVRRSGRTDIPALSLEQYSHFLEGSYKNSLTNGMTVKTGVQLNMIDNKNNPETGILPLVPNYDSWKVSAYTIFQHEADKLFYEIGGRYDRRELKVVSITRTTPRAIERTNHQFDNLSFTGGIKYYISDSWDVSLNSGYTERAPEVNEMYSFGLHQGVSGIEEGTRSLNSEKSLKIIGSTEGNIGELVFFQTSAYYQNIDDFIYLQPQREFRLTIRGAFPVFIYQQADVAIYGMDVLFSYEPLDNVKLLAKYALVKGDNKTDNVPLINMPSNNLLASISYTLSDSKNFTQNKISLSNNYVFRQNELLAEQDLLAPPNAYSLLNLSASTNIQFAKSNLKLALNIENLLNHQYRDYLNRLRYFADDLGRNISLRLNYHF